MITEIHHDLVRVESSELKRMRLWNDSRTTAIEDGPLILTIADATNEPVTISQYHGAGKLIVQFWTGRHWLPGVRAAENRTFFSNFNRKGGWKI